MRIDLHTHSDASDGTHPPEDVVAEAARAGLDVVALTDHDTMSGWQQASAAARAHGITLVPGIEISCVARGISVHLLGYLLDPGYRPLLDELDAARRSRDGRARRIVESLARDVPLAWEDVLDQVRGEATIGRPHIADALVARGVVADRQEAFGRYLYTGSPYYASHYAVDVVTGVRLVREAGGVPVMAHPFAARRGRVVADSVVERMAEAGLAGLEAHHVDHTPEQEAHAVDLAASLGLVVTGASDYHGDGKVNRLGDRLTSVEAFDRIVAAGTGSALVRP